MLLNEYAMISTCTYKDYVNISANQSIILQSLQRRGAINVNFSSRPTVDSRLIRTVVGQGDLSSI